MLLWPYEQFQQLTQQFDSDKLTAQNNIFYLNSYCHELVQSGMAGNGCKLLNVQMSGNWLKSPASIIVASLKSAVNISIDLASVYRA